MGLYERILRLEEPKIPVHAFMAAMAEIRRGHGTRNQFVTIFQLDAAAQADLDVIITRFSGGNPLTGVELHDVLLLADAKAVPVYKTVAALKTRLGV
jgi:hypothetical protein